jgi:hypothetical protein
MASDPYATPRGWLQLVSRGIGRELEPGRHDPVTPMVAFKETAPGAGGLVGPFPCRSGRCGIPAAPKLKLFCSAVCLKPDRLRKVAYRAPAGVRAGLPKLKIEVPLSAGSSRHRRRIPRTAPAAATTARTGQHPRYQRRCRLPTIKPTSPATATTQRAILHRQTCKSGVRWMFFGSGVTDGRG